MAVNSISIYVLYRRGSEAWVLRQKAELSLRSDASPLLARDRQIPALRGKIGTRNGDLAIPCEQKRRSEVSR